MLDIWVHLKQKRASNEDAHVVGGIGLHEVHLSRLILLGSEKGSGSEKIGKGVGSR